MERHDQTRTVENLLYFVTSTGNEASTHAKEGITLPLRLFVNPEDKVLAEMRKGALIYPS